MPEIVKKEKDCINNIDHNRKCKLCRSIWWYYQRQKSFLRNRLPLAVMIYWWPNMSSLALIPSTIPPLSSRSHSKKHHYKFMIVITSMVCVISHQSTAYLWQCFRFFFEVARTDDENWCFFLFKQWQLIYRGNLIVIASRMKTGREI